MKSRALVMIAAFTILTFAFVPSSFSAVVWATDVIEDSTSNVTNSGNSLLAPDGEYASINSPSGYLTVGFGTSFLDLTGPDVVVVDAVGLLADNNHDWDIADVYGMEARRADGSGWSALKRDISFGGWQLLEIPGGYAGLYDQIKLSYIFGIPDCSFEVDAIGVTHSDSTPVPEPSTMLLLGSGLIGIATWGRKKFKGQKA